MACPFRAHLYSSLCPAPTGGVSLEPRVSTGGHLRLGASVVEGIRNCPSGGDNRALSGAMERQEIRAKET